MDLEVSKILTLEEMQNIDAYLAKLRQPSLMTRMLRSCLERIINVGMYTYAPLTVRGIENIMTDESLIVCANHASLLDGIIVGVAAYRVNRSVVGLTAVKYMHSRFLKLLTDFIPFDQRTTKKALAKNLTYLLAARADKKIFILFPEGTRSQNNQLQPFRHATAWIATQTNLKIVPAYITGAYESMPKGRLFPRPAKLTVTFGSPLHIPMDDSPDFYALATEKIRQSIVKLKI